MPKGTQDFAASPITTSENDWKIEDGGMEREAPEDVARTLADNDEPASPAGDTPAPEQAATTTSEPADADGNVESTAATPQTSKDAKPATAEKPKRTLEGRKAELLAEISRLTAQKHTLKREIEGSARPAPVRQATPQREQAAAPVEGLKKPVWSEFESENKTWDEYVDAQDAYLEARIGAATQGTVKAALERELVSLRADNERQAHDARIDAEFKTRMQAVRAAHKDEWAEIQENLKPIEASDFIADVVRLHPSGPELYYRMGKNPEAASILNSFEWTNTMFDAVMASDDPSAMLLHLAENEGEFERIRQMPSAAALFALGALSRSLDSSQARANGSRPRGTTISKAPAPIRPVGSASVAPSDSDDDDDADYLSWFRKENQRDQERTRR